MGWMNNVFGGGYSNPADAAQPYLNKIPGYTDQYMNPYINIGQTAGNIAQQQYGAMASNPSQYFNSLYSGYETSPEYNFLSDQLKKTQNATAASGGFSGTANDINDQMSAQNALLDQNWDRYFNQVTGLQNTGLAGETGMYNTGFGASNNALNALQNYANASAQNQFGGTQASNAMSSGMLGTLLGATGAGLGLYGSANGWFGGNGSSGGLPSGFFNSSSGSGIGNSLGNAGNAAAFLSMF